MRAADSAANPSRSTRTTATRSAGAKAAKASTTRAPWPSVVAGEAPLPPAGIGCTGGSAASSTAFGTSAAVGGAAPMRVLSRRSPSMHAL